MEVSGQLQVPAVLPQQRTPPYIKKEAGWVPEPIWAFLRREKPIVAAGIRTSDRSAHVKLKFLTNPAVGTHLIFIHSHAN